MSDVFSIKKIDALVKNLARQQLLAFLGVEDMADQIGDNECVRPVSASSVNKFHVHKSDVSFLGKVGEGYCEGALIRRFGRSSVGVPCFAVELEENEKF